MDQICPASNPAGHFDDLRILLWAVPDLISSHNDLDGGIDGWAGDRHTGLDCSPVRGFMREITAQGECQSQTDPNCCDYRNATLHGPGSLRWPLTQGALKKRGESTIHIR